MPSLLLQAMIHNNGVSCRRAIQTRFSRALADTNKPEQNTKTKIMRGKKRDRKKKKKKKNLSLSPLPLSLPFGYDGQ